VVDTETTVDPSQALTFGFYRFCRTDEHGSVVTLQEGFFHADELPERDPDGYAVLRNYVYGLSAGRRPTISDATSEYQPARRPGGRDRHAPRSHAPQPTTDSHGSGSHHRRR
jgi:hypothetical protein